ALRRGGEPVLEAVGATRELLQRVENRRGKRRLALAPSLDRARRRDPLALGQLAVLESRLRAAREAGQEVGGVEASRRERRGLPASRELDVGGAERPAVLEHQ